MRFSFLMLGLDVAFTVYGAAVPKTHVLHEKRSTEGSTQCVKRGKIPATYVLRIRIGLKQNNLDIGHELLMDM